MQLRQILFLTTSSFFVSLSTSPADLSSTWTTTAITRTTMTGTVRELCMAAHTPYCLSVCHRRLKRMRLKHILHPCCLQSFLLPIAVSCATVSHPLAAYAVACYCLNSQQLTHHTHPHVDMEICRHTQNVITQAVTDAYLNVMKCCP